MMKKCPKCSTENPDTSKFCSECGCSLFEVEPEEDISDVDEASKNGRTDESKEERNNSENQNSSHEDNTEKVKPDTDDQDAMNMNNHEVTDVSEVKADDENKAEEYRSEENQLGDLQSGNGNLTIQSSQNQAPPKIRVSKKVAGVIVAVAASIFVLVAAVVAVQEHRVVSITAKYNGNTEAGTVLNEKNDGIEVTAQLYNGNSKTISGWTIDKPDKLEADASSKVTIKYKNDSCTLEVKCTTPKMTTIVAEYSGDTQEGVTLGNDNNGIIVKAIYSDRSSKKIDGWEIKKPVTLQRGQTSSVDIEYNDFRTALKVECTTPLKLTSISAEYDGKTEEGTALDASNSGIHVTGTYEDGSTNSVSDWTIANPATLAADQDTTVTITAGDVSCDLTVHCTTESPETFKASCQDVSYNDVARNPDNYKLQKLHIYGQVVQVQDQGDDVILRIATKDSGYGNYYDDVYLVQYKYKEGESKILQDDFVNVYGYCFGSYTYTSVFGAAITVPSMVASYVDIKG